jgi:hypothetical protein
MAGGLHCNFGKAEQGAETKVGRLGDCPEVQDEGHHCHIEEQEQQFGRRVTGRQHEVVIMAAAMDGKDHATLRREQLNDHDLGQILHEMEAGQHPEWNNIADHSPIYKSCWV